MNRSKLFKSLILSILILTITSVNTMAYAQNKDGNIENIIAESAIVMDMDTGEVIASKNADVKRPIASTVKLLTSLMFTEKFKKDEPISFTEDALKTTTTSLNNFVNIKPGDKISSTDLMKAVMIFSANDAAYLMADAVAGNTKDFVKMMNDRVKELGLENTSIVNPSGLERDALNPGSDKINLSTAYDIAVIAKEAYKNPWIKEVISTKYQNTDIHIEGSKIKIESRNKILGQNGNIGGKTGNETVAGHCFVGFFERDGRNLVTVALKSQYGADGTTVFKDTTEIANDGYNAKEQVYKKAGEEVTTTNLEYRVFGFFGPKKTIKAPIISTKDIMYYKNEINDKNAKVIFNTDKSAWKLANKEVELTLSLPNHKEKISGKVDLSLLDIVKMNAGLYAMILVGIILVLIALAFILRFINLRKVRNRRSRRSSMGRRRKNKYRFK